MALITDLHQKTWHMKRNCSLTPKQLLHCYLVLVTFSAIVTIGFLLAGVWMVLVFSSLELTAVTLGFLIYSMHALDREEIQLIDQRLIVRQFFGKQQFTHEFNSRWVRIKLPKQGKKVFLLCQSKQEIELGRFIMHDEQIELISSLRRHLG